MLTGLKVSFLACKCVIYTPEHKAKGNLVKFLKWKAEIS